jgi:hypothetical protein
LLVLAKRNQERKNIRMSKIPQHGAGELMPSEPYDAEWPAESDDPASFVIDAIGFYLHALKAPLLTGEQEVDMAKQIEAGLMATQIRTVRRGDPDECRG